MRVLIADDHAGLRRGLRHSLEQQAVVVCGEAANADDAVARARELRPDVVLLDVNMPGDGFRALERLREEVPEMTIVMLTVRDDQHSLLRAMRAGANGYLLKDVHPHALAGLLADASDGRTVLAPQMVAALVAYVRGAAGVRSRGGFNVELSDREWDVVTRLREGLTTREIADQLSVEPVTVRRHVSNVLLKLNVSTRAEAVALLDGVTAA